MEKISRLIIFLIIIVVIIIGILIVLLNKSENINDEDMKIQENDELAERNVNWHVETNRNRFYDVKNCISEFYRCYESLNRENLDIKFNDTEIDYQTLEKKYSEKLYSMLDKEYINYKNITIDNISEKLGKIEKIEVLIDKIYTKDLENSSYICFVEGRLCGSSSNIKSFKIIVRLSGEGTFKLFLEDYLIEKDYNNFFEEMDVTQLSDSEITNDKYNTYTSAAITTQEYVNDLFNHYKKTMKYDYEYAYELINEDYRNIRFETKEEYIAFAKENRVSMIGSILNTYNQELINDEVQFICEDNYGNYYIFKEIAPFKYTVILDNYTISTKEFEEQYSKKTEIEKVIINIKRFFMGIDDKNYGYSYNVLAESFKKNKYPTKNDFMSYVKQNFFEENNIEYISYEKENGLYIYNIKLTDATGKSSEAKELNVILRLNSRMNFEMSFGVN